MPSRGFLQLPGSAALLGLTLLAACARPPRALPARTEMAAARPLPRLGYTLQAGAFAQVEHAARLARKLQAQGLDAAYYAAPGGLYRVRFGDFATAGQARSRGKALRSTGILDGFWVVPPEHPAPPEPGTAPPPISSPLLRTHLVETARSYMGVPYLFGGTTPRGFDCSGLTEAVYRLNGLRLPRTSEAQYEAGRPVALDDAQPGDLLFFATTGRGTVSHVALYLGHGAFIHAPSEGRDICEDRLAEPYYRRTFVGVRRFF